MISKSSTLSRLISDIDLYEALDFLVGKLLEVSAMSGEIFVDSRIIERGIIHHVNIKPILRVIQQEFSQRWEMDEWKIEGSIQLASQELYIRQ